MGTKIQLDNYHSMRDLNHDMNGTSWPSYYGENSLPNGQYYYGVLPRPNPDLFPGVDKDLLKQKMLEHEAIFKNQVFELHRLYKVQRDLMGEMKRKDEFNKPRTMPYEASSSSQTTPEDMQRRGSSSFLFSKSVFMGPQVPGPEFGSSSGKGKNVQSPRSSVVSESRPMKVRRMIDLDVPADKYVDLDEVDQSENSMFKKPNGLADLNEVPEVEETASVHMSRTPSSSCYSNDRRNGENWFSSMLKAGMNNQSHIVKDESWASKVNNGMNVYERTRFQVSAKCSQSPIQINDSPGNWWNRTSNGSKSLVQETRVPKAGLDFVNDGNSKKAKNCFDLNSTEDLNSNDEVSVLPPWLRAKKSEVRNAVDHQDSVASVSCNTDVTKSERKVLFDMNLPCEDLEEEEEEVEKIESGRSNAVRNMIDLNSCLTEDEVPLTVTSLANYSTTTNSSEKSEKCVIDLEAPVNLEAEDEDDEEEIIDKVADEELAQSLARVAAEAIVGISSLVPKNRVTDAPSIPESGGGNEDALLWFVDIACSGLDSFEEMTLNLTECTVDEYFPNPPKFDFLNPETSGPGPTNSTGRARRGRKKRDFQRDILPGLGSLARHEVTEDLQTFGGLMMATGHDWQCGARKNGSRRGRKKKVITPTPTPTPTPVPAPATFASSQKTGEMSVLVDGSLTSWGKKTRRPRRQRGVGNPGTMALT